MKNQNEITIEQNVNACSVEESNLFLRRLWSEISKNVKNGWNYQPYREERTIFIGASNVGYIKFDYEKKGCIKKIYITTNQDNKEIVTKCLKGAMGAKKPDIYVVSLAAELTEGTPGIRECCYEGIEIYTKDDKLHIIFEAEAYSEIDLKYLVLKKMEIIQDILYMYTRKMYTLFEMPSGSEHTLKGDSGHIVDDSHIFSKTEDFWMDMDEIPMEEGCIILPGECLQLLQIVKKDNFYDTEYQLLFNSARQFYCANEVWKRIGNDMFGLPGYVDIVNSIVTSALEPLSSIICKDKHRCKECGNMVYSISKRICKMLGHYLENEEFAKYLSDRVYGNRSKFFHEGYVMSAEVRMNLCWPQINPVSKNEMLMPCSVYEYNLADYVSYVFRRVASDLLQDNLPELDEVSEEQECCTDYILPDVAPEFSSAAPEPVTQ